MENITRSGTCIELFKDVQPYDFFLKNSAHIDIPSYMVPKCFSGWFRAIVTRVPGRTSHITITIFKRMAAKGPSQRYILEMKKS